MLLGYKYDDFHYVETPIDEDMPVWATFVRDLPTALNNICGCIAEDDLSIDDKVDNLQLYRDLIDAGWGDIDDNARDAISCLLFAVINNLGG